MKEEIIQRSIQSSIEVKQAILDDKILIYKIEETATLMIKTLQNGGKVFFCGNGGSAADAQHLAAELSGRFYFDRPPLNSEALHCNSSYLTAVANDYGYHHVFARLLKGCAKAGDLIIGLSTSGNSENIIYAFETAKELEIKTIAFTGSAGGKIQSFTDILINVPSTDTPRIQEAHITIGHILCEIVEAALFFI